MVNAPVMAPGKHIPASPSVPTPSEAKARDRAEPRRDAAGSPPPVAGRRLDPPGLLLPGGILPAWGVAIRFGLMSNVLLSSLGGVGWTKGGLGFQRLRGVEPGS